MNELHFGVIWEYRAIFLHGALITAWLTLTSAAIGAVLGPLVGLLRSSRIRMLSLAAGAYVEAFRATPTLVQLVWIFYALPVITGIQLDAFTSVMLALGLHEGAYVGEIFRAGINSLDKGQTYAAQALGMSYWQRMRRIILPQVVKRMIPPLINEFASLMKLTSLASVLAIPELLHTGNDVISTTFRPMEIYTAIGAAYAMLVLPIIYLAHHIDRAWGRKAA